MSLAPGVAKAEIHVHIEGTATPRLVERHAARHGVDPSGLFGPDGSYRWHDFASFLDAYDLASSVLRSAEAYRDLACDYAARSASEGVIYLEAFASPDHAADAGLSYRDYVGALDSGFADAERDFGMVARLTVVGLRHRGPEAVEAAARLAASDPHPRVTGFGMAGDERFGRVADFATAFAIAADAGLGLTVHAGEFGGADSVRDALDHLPVKRIGHGVRAVEDPELVRRLAADGITLEVCPGSNVALGLYPDRTAHPLKVLVEAGVKVTLNSDDPPFFDTSVGKEYAAAAEAGFDEEALKGFTRNAIECAFVGVDEKAVLLARVG